MIINAVNEGVKDGDVKRVRKSLAMTVYMANEKAHEDFQDSVSFAEGAFSNLYEEDNGDIIVGDISTENYITIANLLIKNFSKQKTDTILEIGSKLFGKKENVLSKHNYEDQDFFEKTSSQSIFSKIADIVTTVVKRVPKIVWILILVFLVGVVLKKVFTS